MTHRYFLLADAGESLTLRLPLPENPLDALLEAIGALWPVVQPLSLDLTTINSDGTATYAQICQTNEPTPRDDDIRVTTAPTITQAVLADWIKKAGGQFIWLAVYRARAWLGSAWENPNYVTLQDGARTFQIQIEKREDGLWVSGPHPVVMLYAPIHYSFEEEDGWLRARIYVTWGVVWTASGRPGQQALERALQTLIARGWHPDSVPSEFDMMQISLKGS